MNAPQTSSAHTSPGPQETPLTLLRKYWGYPGFRPHQEAIVASVIGGNDTLAILTTGSGKSLCYQLPAVYFWRPYHRDLPSPRAHERPGGRAQ